MFERMLGMHTAGLCRHAGSLAYCMLEQCNEHPVDCCNAACFDTGQCRKFEVVLDSFCAPHHAVLL